MNRNSNSYTVLYAAIMVILVAAVLASASVALRPAQKRNLDVEKKQNILASVNIESTPANAEQLYAEKIVNEYVVNSKGEIVEGESALTTDLKIQHSRNPEERLLPVFECQVEGGLKYVFPLYGTGLWGPIWGFVSLNDDMNTIYGANFDHQSETPGLGAEISTQIFEAPFIGKKIFDESGNLVSVTVVKPGQEAPEQHKVDGISGGTITSKGLEKMLLDDFTSYVEFLKKKKS